MHEYYYKYFAFSFFTEVKIQSERKEANLSNKTNRDMPKDNNTNYNSRINLRDGEKEKINENNIFNKINKFRFIINDKKKLNIIYYSILSLLL